jgi:hypothetical protein
MLPAAVDKEDNAERKLGGNAPDKTKKGLAALNSEAFKTTGQFRNLRRI